MKKILVLMFMLLTASAFGGELQIIGTTDMEDAYIDSGAPANYNYGGSTFRQVQQGDRVLFRTVDLATLVGTGQQIDACTLFVWQSASNYTDIYDSARVYRVLKPWVEGALTGSDPTEGNGCTYNDWSADTYEWGLAGCDNASDGGDDNNTDAGGYDRWATPESATRIGTGVSGTFRAFPISTALAQSWYDGTNDENGVVFISNFDDNDGNYVTLYFSEETTNLSLRPYFKVWYSSTTTGTRVGVLK